jgi:putative transposase
METDVVDERMRFVRDYASGAWSMSELCQRYGVSRPTGYTWVARHRVGGTAALIDRSCAPQQCPHRTSARLERLLVAARVEYGWGAQKLLDVLRRRHPSDTWPARSTVNDILARHALLHKNRRRPAWTHPGAAPLRTVRPNQVWPADFKGQFRTGDGRYCFPLTVTDHFSRRVLLCHGLPSVQTDGVIPAFRALFRAVGLPDAIRTDNGAPFASTALHGLSALNVWWMQLGIVHQRIAPASPQQNGTHERMHRELKRETTRPAAHGRRAQQARFDAFQRRYNEERPHAALGGRTPASVWVPSLRRYPDQIAPPVYPAHMEVRRVTTAGTFRFFADRRPFLSETLHHQEIGLEEVGDGIWNIVYYRTLLGKIDERTLAITGV